jgi:hypothetical protein
VADSTTRLIVWVFAVIKATATVIAIGAFATTASGTAITIYI